LHALARNNGVVAGLPGDEFPLQACQHELARDIERPELLYHCVDHVRVTILLNVLRRDAATSTPPGWQHKMQQTLLLIKVWPW
jgi:hypothetical protein